MYDHRTEVKAHRRFAALLRTEAAKSRADAERAAVALEQYAAREDELADHIHRLCTSGVRARCCARPAPAKETP